MTVENRMTPFQQLGVILITPACLVVIFWAGFIIENEGLSTSSAYLELIAGCILNLLTQGNTECLPDSGYIILCTILGGPFGFYCTYKIWQSLKTKVILTDQKIIKKQPFGKEIQLNWSEIKKVRIISAEKGTQLVFTRTKGPAFFDDNSRIFCPPALNNERPFISPDAATLILKKIDLYNISIKGNRALLEEIIKTPHPSQQEPTRSAAQYMTGANRLPPRPSSAQRPTPK